MTIARRRGFGIASVVIFGIMGGGVGRTLHAGQMTPASISQIQQPGQQNQGQQQPSAPQSPLSQAPLSDDSKGGRNDDGMMSVRARQAKMREDERQKRLVSDTEKLLALATQLHDDVSKTNKDILSIDVIKRADEIEKLAHNVKLGMKD